MKAKIILLILYTSVMQSQTLDWTRPLLDTGHSTNFCIASDNSENTFATGWFSGTVDIDPGPVTHTLYSNGASAYVIKKGPSGDFLWGVNLEGGSSNARFGVCTDNSGNVYVHGFFTGTCDFDPGPGMYTLTSNTATPSQYFGGLNQFIWKLSSTGNLVWAKQIAPNQFVNELKTDASGNLYIAGMFKGNCDFDLGSGVNTLTSLGTQDGFIAVFNTVGDLMQVKQFGGSGSTCMIEDFTIDPLNNLSAIGSFSGSIDVDPGAGVQMLNAVSNENFIVHLNSTGTLLSSNIYGSPNGAKIHTKLLDNNGNVYVAGTFSGTCDFDTGLSTYTMQASNGIFLYKLDSNGDFVWARSVNGTNTVSTNAFVSLGIDGGSNIYFSGGYTGLIDLDPGSGVFTINSGTLSSSEFITTLNSNGDFVSGINSNYNIWTVSYNGSIYTLEPNSVSKYSSLFTSLNELKQDHNLQLTVYPNPGKGEFMVKTNFEFKALDIEVYDQLGQKVFFQTITSDHYLIDLKNYKSGVYFVRLLDDKDGFWQTKIINE